MEDKSWVEGLSNEEYVAEFMRRHPKADSIPDKDEWVKVSHIPEDRSISGFNPELMVPENPIPVDENDELRPVESKGYVKFPDGTWGCVCGYKSKVKVAVYNHHKKCETFLKGSHG